MALVNLRESELTDQQKYAIDLLVGRHESEGELTKQQIADLVGVTRQTVYNWIKKPEFRRELVSQAKTVTDSGMAKSVTWMERALDDPNVKPAVKVQIAKLFMQSHGMLKDVQEQSVEVAPKVDVDALLRQYNITDNETE